jgi:hypothetical protein
MLPLFPFVTLLGMWKTWSSRGRDPELRPVVPAYEPPASLRPAEVGTLVDNSPDMRDLTASIVDLAVRGYLRIEEQAQEGLSALFKRGPRDLLVRLTPPPDRETLHLHE